MTGNTKRCSTSLLTGEIEITIKFHYTKLKIAHEDVERLEISDIAYGNAKKSSPFGKQSGSFCLSETYKQIYL